MKTADKISWKNLQDKVVAVNLTTGNYYTMNEAASAMWKLMAEGKNEDEIVAALTEEFDVDPETARKDFHTQAEYWLAEKLIEQ